MNLDSLGSDHYSTSDELWELCQTMYSDSVSSFMKGIINVAIT